MSEDESFDSFYRKLNEVVIRKFKLGEMMEDSKIVRKILRKLPESCHAKVTAIEESKPMSYFYHLKGRANLLLSRQLIRDWKLKTPRMRMRLKRMWHTLLRTSVSS